jgi:hypothetical protein
MHASFLRLFALAAFLLQSGAAKVARGPYLAEEVAAPDITPGGRLWKAWTEAGLLLYLETGLTPEGMREGPPMPAWNLSKDDARMVVDHRKCLETRE